MTRFSMNLYTNSVELQYNDIQHAFVDVEKFLSDSNFPFSTARIVCCEVERNIFIVEHLGGQRSIGSAEPEIMWAIDNIEVIAALARAEKEWIAQLQAPTWEDIRLSRLSSTDWLVQRHTEQTITGVPTNITTAQFSELLTYRQQLRDTPKGDELPSSPAFLTDN